MITNDGRVIVVRCLLHVYGVKPAVVDLTLCLVQLLTTIHGRTGYPAGL